MPITLVVENGTGLANANTYADESYARSFAADVGLILPADSEACKAALLAAMPYLESQPWQGQRAATVQALDWPRLLVIVDGVAIASNVIPLDIKKAQVQAASEIGSGTDLFPSSSGAFVTEETVGPITTKYSDKQYLVGGSVFASIDVYLKPYINWVGGYRLSPAFGF